MPPRRKQHEVSVRQIGPETADENTVSPLYQPVPQLDTATPEFKIEYVWFTPQKAKEYLSKAAGAPGFKQRPLRPAQVRRWKNLVNTKRFVHFLPNQAICEDEDGVPINGQHRLTGVSQCPEGTQVGFMVIKNVPRWMFAFFDTNMVRTAADVFEIGNRRRGPQTPSAVKLAMRYEEYLTGRRAGTGWRHWNQVHDEHQDLDVFYARRDEIQDWYGLGVKLRHSAKILVASTIVFAFYQSLAWPDGDPELHDFVNAMRGPVSSMSPQSPARLLKEFGNNTWIDRQQVHAKREVHLALLFQSFGQFVRNARFDKITWAYGQPMSVPYHPKGPDVAIKNVRLALEDMDRQFEDSHDG
jgi:hypothetical protein